MKLERVEIRNYRAIERLDLALDPDLTVFHGNNGHGKTSVLSGIAVGLAGIPRLLPDVAGIGFLKSDRRGLRPMRVTLTSTDGIAWRRQVFGERGTLPPRKLKDAMDAIVAADQEGSDPLDLPIVAFYDTDRAVTHRAAVETPDLWRNTGAAFSRYAALAGALSTRTSFREFFAWFYAMENAELRVQRRSILRRAALRRAARMENAELRAQRRAAPARSKALNVVRQAITAMLPGVSEPRVELDPFRFVVSVRPDPDDRFENLFEEAEELALDQLSGGYRIMLALAADLARRMAQGNPHLDDPLQAEAIVLIDEVDLHLHPSWQQRVLNDLRRTFPNTQFIVSTHSPQVLTTVEPRHVVHLAREDGRIVAGSASGWTYGAEAGDVLSAVMGVDERPPGNKFVRLLNDYLRLVGAGRGASSDAVSLRRRLEELSPRDPALDRADVEIRRRKALENLGRSR